ncbi:MAG: hypothetical protein K6G15_08060 [Desulfovibrio sp.]|nr:hypothetical protein [Desulfovibrio sp.]
MERSELEHISVLPGDYVLFRTTCACGDCSHSLTVSVEKDVVDFKDSKSVGVEIEMFFETQWNDGHPWESAVLHLEDGAPLTERAAARLKSFFAWIPKLRKRIATACRILFTGSFRTDESFLFRSGEQAEAVLKAMADAVESFRNGEKEIDALCEQNGNIVRSRQIGS